MKDEVAAESSGGNRWVTILLRVLGLALLALVVWKVDWKDSVVLAGGEVVHGSIVGEIPARWDADSRLVLDTGDGTPRTLAEADLRKDSTTGVPEVNEGILHIVRRSDKTLLGLGFALFGLITQWGVLRWWLLLRAQGIHIRYREALRLTFVGFFFNNVVPGPTGGDVVKAVYVARQTHKRAEAVVTVLLDRIVGIIALGLIGGSMLLFHLDNPVYRNLAVFIGLFLGGMFLAAVLFFSRRIRRLIRLEQWSAKLPGGKLIRRADQAIFLWRYHKKDVAVALLLSFCNQISIQLLMLLFAAGLHVATESGEALHWTSYMVVLPVALIVSAFPMLPGGWGVREAAFAVCFSYVGVGRNPAIALSVLNGMMMLLWSLPGGVVFLLGRSAFAAKSPAGEAAPVPEPVAAGDSVGGS